MAIKVYEYKICSTCRKAIQFLELKGIKFERQPIVESPPSKSEIRRMLGYLQERGEPLRALFNVSGQLYRELGIAEQIKNGLSEADAIDLLSQHGKLIKRPFLLTADGGAVGFKEEEWRRLLIS